MPAASAVRGLPWKRILAVAQIVLNRLSEDIPAKDRRLLREILASSKGDPRRLSSDDRRHLLRILRQVDVVKLRNEVTGAMVAGKLLRR